MNTARLVVYFWLSFVTVASSQTADVRNEFMNEPGYSHTLEFSGGFYASSDAITHTLMSDYYFHRYITKDVKDRISRQLSAMNRFGVAFQGQLNYCYQPQSTRTRFIFTMEHCLNDESKFNQDLFDLYFRGNKGFAGTTADLDNSRFRSLLCYKIGFGVGQGTSHDRTNWFAIGSLCIGDEFLDVSSTKGSLFTSMDGDYIDADLDINLHRSDSAKSGPFNVNGKGFALTAGISSLVGEHTRLHAAIRNIGFVRFNDRSGSARIDTSLRFEGIDANTLFSFTDSFHVIQNDSDYVQQFITDRRKASYTRLLPGTVDVWLEKWLGGNEWNVAIGLRTYINTFARPLGWLDISKTITAKSTLRLHTQYGGYSRWNAGIGYEFTSGGWSARISSDFIASWMNVRSGCSMGAFVSLSKSF